MKAQLYGLGYPIDLGLNNYGWLWASFCHGKQFTCYRWFLTSRLTGVGFCGAHLWAAHISSTVMWFPPPGGLFPWSGGIWSRSSVKCSLLNTLTHFHHVTSFHIHGTSKACNSTCLGDAQLSYICNNIEVGTRLHLWVFLVPLIGCPSTLVWLLSPMLAAHSPNGSLSLNCVQGRALSAASSLFPTIVSFAQFHCR